MSKPETPIWAFNIDDKDLVLKFVWDKGPGKRVHGTRRGHTGWIRVIAAYRGGTSTAIPDGLQGPCRGHLCAKEDCEARWKPEQYAPHAPPRPVVLMFGCPIPPTIGADDASDAALAGAPADAAGGRKCSEQSAPGLGGAIGDVAWKTQPCGQ